MFKEVIRSTALTTPAADTYFQSRVYGDYYSGDVTLVATLRALMDKRMPEGKVMRVRIVSGMFYNSDEPSREINLSLRDYLEMENTFCLYDARGNQDNLMANIDEYMKSREGFGWKRIDEVTGLFRKSFEVSCFVNTEQEMSLVVVHDLSIKKYHLLQCAILGMIPWYYNPADGISDAEKELIYSLREKTSEKYIEAVNKIAEAYNFEYERMKTLLNGFESKVERMRIEEIEQNNEGLQRNIVTYNSRIGDALAQINENNIILLGLRESIKQKADNSELLQYFMSNKCVVLDEVSDSTIFFSVKGYLAYFDEDIAKRMIDNMNGSIYDYRVGTLDKTQVKKFLYAVFIDQDIRIKFCASYKFNLRGTVEALAHHRFPATFDSYMPNPHIQEYSCMGDYSRNITTLLMDHNYIGALEQACASCKSLNWADSAVMHQFMNYLSNAYNSEKLYFELPDETFVSMKDAIKWIEENKKTEGEDANE